MFLFLRSCPFFFFSLSFLVFLSSCLVQFLQIQAHLSSFILQQLFSQTFLGSSLLLSHRSQVTLLSSFLHDVSSILMPLEFSLQDRALSPLSFTSFGLFLHFSFLLPCSFGLLSGFLSPRFTHFVTHFVPCLCLFDCSVDNLYCINSTLLETVFPWWPSIAHEPTNQSTSTPLSHHVMLYTATTYSKCTCFSCLSCSFNTSFPCFLTAFP